VFNPLVNAHTVLLARGDYYTDAEGAGGELSFNDNGFLCAIGKGTGPACADSYFPLVLAESPSNLGSYVTTFLNNAGLAVSGLAGELPAFGWQPPIPPAGHQANNASSSVYTIEPIGGPLALTPSTTSAALSAVTAG
jgi:hypothetical protein